VIEISSNSEEGNSYCNKAKFTKMHDQNDSFLNLNQLIEDIVIPKWTHYMRSKTERREGDAKKKPRTDTFRKKILRDMREFYRTLFRKRFHLSEYKTIEGIQECLKTMFEELGITLDQSDLNDFQLFRYVHQTHQYTTKKMFRHEKDINIDSPFKVIEKYNELNLKKFMRHPLSSKMFFLVFNNYLQHYQPLVKRDYRNNVVNIIMGYLNCYKRMSSEENLLWIE